MVIRVFSIAPDGSKLVFSRCRDKSQNGHRMTSGFNWISQSLKTNGRRLPKQPIPSTSFAIHRLPPSKHPTLYNRKLLVTVN